MLGIRLQKGISLIEVVISLAIVSLTLGIGVSGLGEWTRNAQIRAAAESIQTGLQLARSEAIRSDARVRFQLVQLNNSVDCSLATTGLTWIVSLNEVSGKCDQTPEDPPPLPTLPDADNPYIVQIHPMVGGASTTRISASQSLLIFNSLGRRAAVNGTLADVTIDISNPSGGVCRAVGGSVRCLQIIISTTGASRICDPSLAGGDPRAC